MSLIRNVIFGLVLGGTVHFVAWSQDAISDGSIPSAPNESADTPPATTGETFPWNPPEQSSELTDADSRYEVTPGEDPNNHLLLPFVKHLADDQGAFWTTPVHFHVHVKDLRWGLPFAGATAGLIASDNWISRQIPASQVKRNQTISDYGTYSFIGAGAGAFLLGNLTRNDRMSEAGLLSGEAAINSTAVAYVFKNMTRRPRPFQANGTGRFFQGGSSFPSEHAAIAWSVASVMAHEYPGTLTRVLAYGLATTVSATRVTGQQHFASDVIIGSALGWYFGRQVYRSHHDTGLGGGAWGDVLPENSGEQSRNPKNMGSPYVPLDSWIYRALDRLIALGYVKTAYQGIRPWTRLECARMLEEAEPRLEDEDSPSGEGPDIYRNLVNEFASEARSLSGESNVNMSVDSIYTRFTGVTGPPLRDGFHFASTLINDYGRPDAEGFNNVTGLSAHAALGPFSFSLQSEYQNAGPSPSDPAGALQLIAAGEDGTPPLPNGMTAISRLRLLDSSVGITFNNFELSFGKESLWLGPGSGGPFLFSNNAEPIPMLRLEMVSPTRVPGFSRLFGPIRTEFAIGRMAGTEWIRSQGKLFGPSIVNQPWLHVEKISFKPTQNFEFGIGVSAVFGGPGSPVTWGNFFKTYSLSCSIGKCPISLAANNYGDRRSTAEFSYRLPHLRDWITLYGDSLVEDEFSPIGSSRPALRAGIYLPKIPKVNKLDLRAESVYTDAPNTLFIGNYYSNSHYLSGYTNYKQIMGSWIGRAGKGGQAWATYWISPRTSLQLQYRREVVSRQFLEGGGLNDFGVKADIKANSFFSLQAFMQYETWKFPALAPAAKADMTASVQLTFSPRWRVTK
jgi:membrane-associated phospholipid phosphatase